MCLYLSIISCKIYLQKLAKVFAHFLISLLLVSLINHSLFSFFDLKGYTFPLLLVLTVVWINVVFISSLFLSWYFITFRKRKKEIELSILLFHRFHQLFEFVFDLEKPCVCFQIPLQPLLFAVRFCSQLVFYLLCFHFAWLISVYFLTLLSTDPPLFA